MDITLKITPEMLTLRHKELLIVVQKRLGWLTIYKGTQKEYVDRVDLKATHEEITNQIALIESFIKLEKLTNERSGFEVL